MKLKTRILKFCQNKNFTFLRCYSKPDSVHEFNQSYDDNISYEMMENDEVRNHAYRKAIHSQVKDQVVIEIGTGKSLFLPKICMEANSQKIHTIEANENSFMQSEKLIDELGWQDKIKIYQGFSLDTKIEEKGDILVHEIIGAIGSWEGMVLAVDDAKKRFP